MKITNAWIDDPTTRNELVVPQLCVEVTEHPSVTIEVETFAGGWSVSKYGPFVKYVRLTECAPEDVDAGDFNVRFRNKFPVVVDIQLFIGSHDQAGIPGFSLPLTRARQLTRKYDRDWRLLISDKSAEHGKMLWLPVETNPRCKFWMEKNICGERPTRTIRVKDTDVPMCNWHVRTHNEKFAAKRTAKTSNHPS